MLRSCAFPALLLASLVLAACHDGSSGSSSNSLPASENLGLAVQTFFGAGDHWLVTVDEAQQGRDLDGDGDQFDRVVHRLDLASGAVQNTGLAIELAHTRGDVVPSYLMDFGATFALGVPEGVVGGLDRNGDGDAQDAVLALVDPESGALTNLGFATGRIELAGEVVAFDVPEFAQGEQDLDGDGIVDPFALVPHLHDLGTGVTRSSGLSGARIVGADDTRVAMAELEGVVGDKNGDGDALDLVLAFYDPATDVLTSAGLALPSFNGVPSRPFSHQGFWLVYVDEFAQGLGDLNGDGSVAGGVPFAFDPRTGGARNLVDLLYLPVPGVGPMVLTESLAGGFVPWLYDAGSDQLVSTGRSCGGLQGLGGQLILSILEELEGQDLDGNGVLDGVVPAVLDPASGITRNLGIDGFPIAAGKRVLILSEEAHARNDWNGDGDRADVVLHVWDEATSQLENTRLVTRDAVPCTGSLVLFLRSEDEQGSDLNGDGDRVDRVAHVYDASSRHVTNLALAADFLLGLASAGQRGFLFVSEASQGADLNRDGDELDQVLHLVGP